MLRLTFAWICSNAYAFDCNLSIKNMLVFLTQFLVKVTFTLHYQQATNSILLNILKFLHFLLKEDLNVHHITRAFKQLLISACLHHLNTASVSIHFKHADGCRFISLALKRKIGKKRVPIWLDGHVKLIVSSIR